MSHLTSCTPTAPNTYFNIPFTIVIDAPAPYTLLTFHIPNQSLLVDHPFSAVWICLFLIFSAALYIWMPSLRTRHAVVLRNAFMAPKHLYHTSVAVDTFSKINNIKCHWLTNFSNVESFLRTRWSSHPNKQHYEWICMIWATMTQLTTHTWDVVCHSTTSSLCLCLRL